MVKVPTNSFRNAAIAHGSGTLGGNAQSTNRAHDRVIKALQLLRLYPDQGREALSELAKDSNNSVRAWAATYLLPLDQERAITVLEDVARNDESIIGLDAEIVLREWKAGRLKLLA